MGQMTCGTKCARFHFEKTTAYIRVEKGKRQNQWNCNFTLPIKNNTVILNFELIHDENDIQGAFGLAQVKIRKDLEERLKANPDAKNAGDLDAVIRELDDDMALHPEYAKAAKETQAPYSVNDPKTFIVEKGKLVDPEKGKVEHKVQSAPQKKEEKTPIQASSSGTRRIVLIAGPSGSGKTTLAAGICPVGYRRVVTYTTRPMRQGEKSGVDYFFLMDNEFEEKKVRGDFLETASYRGWQYGTPSSLPDSDCCLVLTPGGIRKALKKYPGAAVIYLKPDRRTCLMRMLERGDDIDEACRRSLTDVGQFDEFENEADLTIDGDLDEAAVLEKAVAFLETFDPDKKAKGTNLKLKQMLEEIYKLL